MATTTEELVVKVTVDSQGAVKGIKLAGDGVRSFNDALADGEKEATKFERQLGALGVKSADLKKQFTGATASVIPMGAQLKLLGTVGDQNVKIGGRLASTFGASGSAAVSAAAGVRQYAQELAKAQAAARPMFTSVRELTGSLNDLGDASRKLQAPTGKADFAKKAAERFRAGPTSTTPTPPSDDDVKKASLYERALGAIGMRAVVVNQALELAKKAFQAVSGAVEATVGAYIDSERADKLLVNTLKITGAQTGDALKGFRDFAKTMQQTTTVSESAAESMLAMAKAAGVSDEMAKQLVKTSADLATANGRDVESSFRSLIGSLKGEAGELANVNPKIKDFSEGALRSGAAVKLLAGSLKGLAEADAKTLGGALTQLSNSTTSLLKEIGGAIVDAFHVPDGIKLLRAAIDGTRDAIVALRAVINQFNAALARVNWDELRKSLLIVTGLIVAFGVAWNGIKFAAIISFMGGLSASIAKLGGISGVVTSIRAMAVAWAEVGVAMVVATAEFAIIAVAIGGVLGAIEILIRNANKLGDVFSVVWRTIVVGLNQAARTFTGAVGTILSGLETALESVAGSAVDIGGVAEKALGKVRTAISANLKISEAQTTVYEQQSRAIIDLKKNLDFTTLLGQGFDFVKDMLDRTKQTKDEAAKIAPPPKDTWKRLLETVRQLSQELMEMGTEVAAIGAGEVAQIQVALAGDLQRINAKREELRVQGLINAATEQLIKDQELVAKVKAQALIDNLRLEKLKQLREETNDLADQVESHALGQIGLLEQQEQIELRKLALKEKQLDKDGHLTEAAKEQVALQRKLIAANADASKKAATNAFDPNAIEKLSTGLSKAIFSSISKGKDEFSKAKAADKANRAGESLSKGLSGIGSVIGSVGGIMNAAMSVVDGMLDFAKQVIEFIPKILGKIAEVFNMLTDFPTVMTKAVQGFIKAIVKFVSNFIPQLFEQIPTILDTIVTGFLDKIPDAFIKMLDTLPEVIVRFLSRMDEVVGKLISGLISGAPKFVKALVFVLIKALPSIVKALFKDAFVDMPKAIVKGIVDGIREAAGAISQLFTGKGPKVDTKGVEKAFQEIGKQATGVSEGVFKVLDLAADAKGMDLADKIASAIDSSTGRAANIFQRMFDFLKRVWDGIFGTLKTVWGNLIEVMQALWNGLTSLWRTTWDNIIVGLTTVFTFLKKVWDAALEFLRVLWTNLMQVFQSVWNGLVELWRATWNNILTLFNDAIAALGKIWSFVQTEIIGPLVSGLERVWNTIVKPIVDGLTGAFTSLLANLKEALGAIANMGAPLAQAGKDLLADIKSTLSVEFWKDKAQAFITGITDKVSSINWPAFPELPAGVTDLISGKKKWPGLPDFSGTVSDLLNGKKGWPAMPAFPKAAADLISNNTHWPSMPSLPKAVTDLVNGATHWPELPTITLPDITQGFRDKFYNLGNDIWNGLSAGVSNFDWASLIKIPGVTGGGGGKSVLSQATGGVLSSTGGLVKSRYAATGDMVAFRPRGSDTVPYMLTPGEFIVNAPAAQSVGRDFLNRVNRGEAPGGSMHTSYDISLTIKNDAPLDEEFVKRKLVPMFIKEVEFQSTHGRAILNVKGLRK